VGALKIALDVIETALQMGEGGGFVIEGAGEVVGVDASAIFVDDAVPEASFAAAQAAGDPLGVDEYVDEEALVGRAGLKTGVEFGGEVFEIGLAFADDDFGCGVDAGGGVIDAGGGFSGNGSGAGGFLRIAAIRFDL
jgi:hypothetical protein